MIDDTDPRWEAAQGVDREGPTDDELTALMDGYIPDYEPERASAKPHVNLEVGEYHEL